MGEAEVVQRSGDRPVTKWDLVRDLRALGVGAGGIVLAHSSLSRIGWVCGGAQAVIEALLEVIGPDGTLVMPAFSTSISNPANWVAPPVPESWWPVIRQHSPAYDPDRTPTRGIGAVGELFRTWPGVRRSEHPLDSFAAIGPETARILHPHPLEDGMGENSPLARLYDLGGRILMLGSGHANNTSLHLAEHRAHYPGKRRVTEGAPMPSGWVEFESLYYDDRDFAEIGRAFGERAARGPMGRGEALWMSQRELVDFGVAWMGENR